MALSKDLTILQGASFAQVVRWESSPIVYKPITGITQVAPARITCPSHGVPPSWRVAVVSVLGMTQINATKSPPRDPLDYRLATVYDVNTIDLNDVNAAGFSAYTSGGYVQYNTPVDLTGYSAEFVVKDKIGGTVLDTLTSDLTHIVIDVVNYKITVNIDAATTGGFTWTKGVYELRLTSATGVKTILMAGNIAITREVIAP
jgi:hypothetical protein